MKFPTTLLVLTTDGLDNDDEDSAQPSVANAFYFVRTHVPTECVSCTVRGTNHYTSTTDSDTVLCRACLEPTPGLTAVGEPVFYQD